MPTAIQQDEQYVVVGLGLTGLSCVRYLADQGCSFAVADSRSAPPCLDDLRADYPDADLRLGEFSDATFADADVLVLSPGIDPREPAIRRCRERGVPVTGDVDIFAARAGAPIVAVTGSNAKSTVVTLLGEMAAEAGVRAAVAGNIGKPVLDLLREEAVRPAARSELYILELSSFQLENTRDLGAEVAAILNVSADHMDRYASPAEYHQAKQRIFQAARQVVVNRDDPLSAPPATGTATRWSFGLAAPARPPHLAPGMSPGRDFRLLARAGEPWLACGDEPLMAVSELKLAGRHNSANALAALALGRAAGLPMASMLEALRRFPGLPHRCQWVGSYEGVDYYNDSKGTNVGACIAAMEGLADKGPVILLAGGVGKGADFSPLAAPVSRYCRMVVLFGEAADAIAGVIGSQIPVRRAAGLPEAVSVAADAAVSGDVVLLSPACASFDMFRDYRHRGDVFTRAVKELQAA